MFKQIIALVLCFVIVNITYAQEQRTVSGKVSDGYEYVKGVTVEVLNKNIATVTDGDGFYRIPVETSDLLYFSGPGMKPLTIQVEDVTRILNPVLILTINELDGVTVIGSASRTQTDLAVNYDTDPYILRTAFGYTYVQGRSNQSRVMNEDNMMTTSPCILDLLRNRWPSFHFDGDCEGNLNIFTNRSTDFVSGGRGRTWDVDGVILNNPPLWIDANSIKRIAVFATLNPNLYPNAIGNAGIIIINTHGANRPTAKTVNRAVVNKNSYDNQALDNKAIKANWPSYKKELYASTSVSKTQSMFKKLAKKYANSPYFFLDAQAYFTEEWDRPDLGEEVIKNNFERYNKNPVFQKALAYQYQAQGQYEKANDIYKKIFLMRPYYAQSYLDMARSYREVGNPLKSAGIHARYRYLQQQGFLEVDTVGIGPVMDRELANLRSLEKDIVVENGNQHQLITTKNDFKGTRVVFEWNDGEAEFELQFVKPDKQYHTWKHSLANNDKLITREKNLGYSTMEELLDGSVPGIWQVNVKYLGNKSLTPTYLKASVYYNYGEISQRKEVKLFKLSLKNINQELFKLRNSSGLVSN